MSGTTTPTPAAHSGATFEKVPDVTSPPASPPPAAQTTPPPAPAVVPPAVVPPAVDPAAAVGNLVADPAKPPVDPAADPVKDPAKDPPAALKPEDYKIEYPAEIPDGAKDPLVAGFLPIAAKHNLSNETVQALLLEMGPVIRNQQNTAYDGMQRQWQTEWKADADMGGAKMPEVIGRIQHAITTFASDAKHAAAINEAMIITGAGNNLPINRLINNMAMRLAEGTPVNGNGAGNTPPPTNPAAVMYNHPSSQPNAPGGRRSG